MERLRVVYPSVTTPFTWLTLIPVRHKEVAEANLLARFLGEFLLSTGVAAFSGSGGVPAPAEMFL